MCYLLIMKKEPYILGSKHYKRFIKGPCTMTEVNWRLDPSILIGPKDDTGRIANKTTIADVNDVVDTKGIKNRKNVIIIPQ